MTEKIKLVGGPGDGEMIPRPLKPGMLALPLDPQLNILKSNGDHYAYAIYAASETANEYQFRGAQRKNPDDGFDVEFIDGPMKGVHKFGQAIQLTDAIFQLPLDSSHKPLKQGNKVGAVAQYKRKFVENAWKMSLVEVVNAPAETERFADFIGESMFTEQLGIYTARQLVDELMRRDGFIGVVVMHPTELLGNWTLKAGSELMIAHNPKLSVENIRKMLRDALTALDTDP